MSSAPSATGPTTAPPGIMLMLYRANVAGLDAARGVQCDDAWIDLDEAPVRLHARKPQTDSDTDEHPPPPAPMGRAEIVRARLAARGPSRLRYEILPTEDAPAASATHHKRRRGDAQLAGASGDGAPAVVGGHRQPANAGLYGSRRGPTTATPRARTANTRAPPTSSRRIDAAAKPGSNDVKQEPRTARPTGWALAVRPYDRRSSVAPATAGPTRPTISAPMPLQRKRRRGEDADAAMVAPPSKRRACLQITSKRA